jgi:adenosylcobinamide-GDP ribazoletransferase
MARHVDNAIHAQLRACASALTFFTRLPLGRLVKHSVNDLAGSLVYFPLVGLVVGVTGAGVFAAALAVWPPVLALLLSTAATVLMTGAFHEDALADAFDGFGGGWNATQILEIMKDSRVGSYALVGVLLVVATKLAALIAIFDGASSRDGHMAIGRALVAGHVVGRWSSVLLILQLPYVRMDADGNRPPTGQPFAPGATRARVAISSIIMILIIAAALGRAGAGVIVVALGVVWLSGRYLVRRIGGITGDALGAVNQLVEVATYLTLAASPR